MTKHPELAQMILRKAGVREIRALADLVQEYYRFDRIAFDRKTMEAGLKSLVKRRSLGQAWLILWHAQTIGYVVATFGFDLEFGGRQATVTDLYIAPHFRRRGMGREALRQVEKFARAQGVQALELQVTSRNAKALAFYKRCGFEAHDRIPMSKRLVPPRVRV